MSPALPADVTPARFELWRCFADVFLDTELPDTYYPQAANLIVQSGFSLAEVRSIFWHEVFPALKWNTRALPGGVWAGWPDEYLLQTLRPHPLQRPRRFGLGVGMLRPVLARIESHLPAGFQ